MDKIEIRRNKKLYIGLIIFFAVGLIAFNAYWFISGAFRGKHLLNIAQLGVLTYFFITSRKLLVKLHKNEPVLTITEEYLHVNDAINAVLFWNEISFVTVIKNDDIIVRIQLFGNGGMKEFSIQGLDRSANEIIKLLKKHTVVKV